MQKPSLSLSPYIIGTMRLGKWGEQFNTSKWLSFIEDCLPLGLNDFDHADIYGDYSTESDFGKALKASPQLRQKIQITSKCGIRMPAENRPGNKIKSYDTSPQYIIQSVDNSLKALQTDYLDVLLIHRPDFLMDPYEIAETFAKLKEAGKVRYFGVSNFSTSQFQMLNDIYPLITHQIELSLTQLKAIEDGTLDQLLLNKITPTAWSPLGGGQSLPLKNKLKDDALSQCVSRISKKYNITDAQVFLAWLKRHPSGIIPVLGTSKIERVKEAVAVKDLLIESEDWYELYSASKGSPLP